MSAEVRARPVVEDLLARQRSGRLDPAELDAWWGELPVVGVEEILGRWKGTGFDTGHRALAQLAGLKWFGKDFVSALDAKPVLCHDDNGDLYSNTAAGNGGEATLWMAEYRGEVTATMIYDALALYDHFKKIDDNTLLGVMNGKDPARYLDGGHLFYFLLERV